MGQEVDDSQTVESLGLFGRTHELHVYFFTPQRQVEAREKAKAAARAEDAAMAAAAEKLQEAERRAQRPTARLGGSKLSR